MALDPVAETILDQGTYGFRSKRSTADAIKGVFNATARKNGAEWVLEGDIKGCFDNISHEWLRENVPLDKKILMQWLKAGIVFNGEFSDTEAGTPQGGIISPCLANLALNRLGSLLKKEYADRKTVYHKVHTIAYADDFIVTGDSKELLETKNIAGSKKVHEGKRSDSLGRKDSHHPHQ
jgi:RNA-directed DNA polymerase